MSGKELENGSPEQKKYRVDNDTKPEHIQIEERFSYLLKKYPHKSDQVWSRWSTKYDFAK